MPCEHSDRMQKRIETYRDVLKQQCAKQYQYQREFLDRNEGKIPPGHPDREQYLQISATAAALNNVTMELDKILRDSKPVILGDLNV